MKNVVKLLAGLAAMFLINETVLGGVYSTPALPVINTNNIVNVLNAGAVGDGVKTNTTAIQAAITLAASGGKTNGATGGTVEFPAGVYLSGPFTLKSDINLQLDSGAVLRMLPFTAYPKIFFTNVVTTFKTNSGVVTTILTTNITWTAANFISASSLTNIEISGSGMIDGQGLPWWPYANTNGDTRPIMIQPANCNRVLIENVTLSNSPMFHIAVSGSKAGNLTVQGVTIRANSSDDPVNPGHNTDACDVAGTNILVQNCNISVGDDDFTCGGGTSGVLLTNNTYGNGHGISIGSFTDAGGVSNITVVNCTINGADNGIRIKSDNDRGGLVHNISYINIGITNVSLPIQIYSYYEEVGTPNNISALTAATEPLAPTNSLTPVYRDITFSNITATAVGKNPVGIIWGRKEMAITNVIFQNLNLSGNRNFGIFNASGIQFIDSNITVPANTNTFTLYNAHVIISNSVPTNTLFSFDGLTTNGIGNTFAFYNARTSLTQTNVLDDGPVLVSASTLSVSNNLTEFPTTSVSYVLGTNAAQVAVFGNLALGGTNLISTGSGFSNGVYTLMTYTGTLSGTPPALAAVPAGYNYAFDTSVTGQVNLDVTLLPPTGLVATVSNLLINLNWNAVMGANSYNVKRGTTSGGPYTVETSVTGTGFADTSVSNTVSYYYVVTAVGAGGESTNSLEVSATPLPSNQPTSLAVQAAGGQLQLSWTQDHLGWRLQIQTNDLSSGLGTNWSTVANSTNVNAVNIPVDAANGSVFLRLVYP